MQKTYHFKGNAYQRRQAIRKVWKTLGPDEELVIMGGTGHGQIKKNGEAR